MPFQVVNCCFCVNLRTGSLIIGYLNLIGSLVLSIFLTIYFIADVQYFQKQYFMIWEDYVYLTFLGLNMVLSFMSLLFTIALIYGINKYQHRYIRPYIIFNAIFLIFHVIDVAVSFTYSLSASDIVINVISLILTAYFLLVVRSYWLQLKTNGPTPASGIVMFAPQTAQPLPAQYPATGGYPVPASYPAPTSYPAPASYNTVAGYPAPTAYSQAAVVPQPQLAQQPTAPFKD